MSQQLTKQEDPSDWSDDPEAEQVPCYQHARWDEINSLGRFTLYTVVEIQKKGYCTFLGLSNGDKKFCCAEALSNAQSLYCSHHAYLK